jgi:hypothetical protein
LPAKRPVQSMDFLRQKYRIREQVPTGARGTLWERACSRRVRCSRWISCVRNTAFANKADLHPGRSYRSTRYLVGASLLAKSPVQSMDFLRQEYSLREHVRSYGSTRYLVGASLLAKRALQSMDFLRQEYSLREQVRSYRSTRYLVGASLLAKSPVQSMDFLRQEYRLREQGGSPPRSLLQEYSVSCGSELAREEAGAVDGFSASGIPPSRTSSYGSTLYLVGASLLAKASVRFLLFRRTLNSASRILDRSRLFSRCLRRQVE